MAASRIRGGRVEGKGGPPTMVEKVDSLIPNRVIGGKGEPGERGSEGLMLRKKKETKANLKKD